MTTAPAAHSAASKVLEGRNGSVCPIPPRAVIAPQITPRTHGCPRPVRLPSSESASAKPMLMPAPADAARPTRNASLELCVANAEANTGASVETDPSINPASPGWTICRTNNRRCAFSSSAFTLAGSFSLSSSCARSSCSRSSLIRSSSSCRTLASWRAPPPFRKIAASPHFHRAGFFADRFDAQRPNQPECWTLHKSAHILTANQRNVFTELLLVEFDQAPAVTRFFLAHAFKHRRRSGIILSQPFGKVGVDALVFFLQSNGQREHFAFRKFLKLLHGDIAYLSESRLDKSKTG